MLGPVLLHPLHKCQAAGTPHKLGPPAKHQQSCCSNCVILPHNADLTVTQGVQGKEVHGTGGEDLTGCCGVVRTHMLLETMWCLSLRPAGAEGANYSLPSMFHPHVIPVARLRGEILAALWTFLLFVCHPGRRGTGFQWNVNFPYIFLLSVLFHWNKKSWDLK